MSLTAPQAGETSQTNDREHTIVSSILTDPIFRRNHERRAVLSEPSLERRRSWDWATRFKTQNRHNNSISSNINLDLGFSEIKDKTTVHNPLNPSIKIICWKPMNRTASNWNIESLLARSKLLTNWSNNDPNNTIQQISTPRLPWESNHNRTQNYRRNENTLASARPIQKIIKMFGMLAFLTSKHEFSKDKILK